jgi:hypothetical protein
MRELRDITRYEIVTGYVNTILNQIDFIEDEHKRSGKDDNFKKHFGTDSFNKAFRTIRLKLPRQTGNSQIVYELLKKLRDSCLFVDKEMTKRDFNRKYFIEEERIYTRVQKMFGRNHFKYVVVDGASYIDERELEGLFHLPGVEFFILIG